MAMIYAECMFIYLHTLSCKRVFEEKAFQWRHTRDMSQITGNSTDASTICSG